MAHKKGHKSKRPKSTRPPSKSSERISRLGLSGQDARAATIKDDDYIPPVRTPGTKPAGKKTGKVYDNQAKKRFAANKAANTKPSKVTPPADMRKKSNSSSVSKPRSKPTPQKEAPKGSSPIGIAQVSAPAVKKEAFPGSPKAADNRPLSVEKFKSGWAAISSGVKNVVSAVGKRKKQVERANEFVSADRRGKAVASLTKNKVKKAGTTPSSDFDAGHTGVNKVATKPAAKSPGARASAPKPTPATSGPPKAPAPMNPKTSGGKKKVPTGVGYDRMGPSARSASKPTQYKDNAKASRSAASVNLNTGSIEDKFGAAMSKIFGSYEAASGVEGTDSYKTKKYNKGKRTK